MTSRTMPISHSEFRERLKFLSEPGRLGFYDRWEMTEVLGYPPSSNQPFNIFSLGVPTEKKTPLLRKCQFLNDSRLKIKGLKGWTFGINVYERNPEEIQESLGILEKEGIWKPADLPLSLAPLVPTRPQFVPIEGTQHVPLNGLLKNNFYNGSYICELFDNSKERTRVFSDTPGVLLSLSSQIQKYLPLNLAVMMDRLGNVIFQIPVSILTSHFSFEETRGVSLETFWDSRATKRACVAITSTEFDSLVLGFGAVDIGKSSTKIITPDTSDLTDMVVWDKENQLILSYLRVAPILQVNMSMNPLSGMERTISSAEPSSGAPTKIVLQNKGMESHVGERTFDYRIWPRKRLYAEEIRRLEAEKAFMQYGVGGSKASEKNRALEDLRWLIREHGAEGAYLWDPYLDHRDILDTLAHNPHLGATMRAIGMHRKRPDCKSAATPAFPNNANALENWKKDQVQGFSHKDNNHLGLALEFRVAHAIASAAFHDRFLIFPKKESTPLAWSIGISVNSLGSSHHILQKVTNGRLVEDAFNDLWDRVQDPNCLVWRNTI